MSKNSTENYYHKVLEKIEPFLKAETQADEFNLDWIRMQGYWKAGKLLETEALKIDKKEFKKLRDYLSKKLEFKNRKLFRVQQFYRRWPKAAPAKKPQDALSWSKYEELLSVSEEKALNYYLQETISSDWSSKQLRKAIRQNLYQNKNNLKRYVQGKLTKLHSLINTFWAQVLHVLDGDTLRVRIDLRFGTTITQDLRLRGINCYELNDPNGLGIKAKEFVEKELQDATWVLIVTYKTDKFGRYVADVYYSSVYETEEELLAKGYFLNQRLLDAGLAKRVEY
ncbi:MAG: thermonuclease family protein [Deltaproteobacteria bacterium]|nr:thermonuclease family protein [Deltaproteobacteria bacterium]